MINRTTAYNETLLITILHCDIYLASKYTKNYVFLCEQHHIDENVNINCAIVCATCGYINAANLWGPGSYSPQHNEVYKINPLMHDFFS